MFKRYVLSWLAAASVLTSVSAAEMKPLPSVADGSPHSAVARLNNSAGLFCTAVLVAPDLAVTAAHCLVDPRTKRWVKPSEIHLLFGYSRGEYGFHARASAYEKGGFDPTRQLETMHEDWALVRLIEPPPPRFSRLATQALSAGERSNVMLTGFAKSRRHMLSKAGPCAVSLRKNLLVGPCPALPGMSGAPLVNDEGRLIGLQIGFTTGSRRLMVAVPSSAWTGAKLD